MKIRLILLVFWGKFPNYWCQNFQKEKHGQDVLLKKILENCYTKHEDLAT